MTGTASYLAGIEANSVQLSYAPEATWGTLPATTFQALRMTGESLAGKKTRARPSEIRTDAQVSAAITQSKIADGAINFALSYGTYDDLLASLFNADWSADLNLSGSSGDIAFAASGNQITSTTSGKFTTVQVGQWIKVSGCTTSSGANNGRMRVSAKPDNQTLTIAAGKTLVNETPAGSAVKIHGSMIRNSNVFHSVYMQKMLSSSLYLRYPGCQITSMTLSQQQGKFVDGSFNVMAQQEAKATTDASTGGVTAAPTGRVIDTVADFLELQVDNAALTGTVQALNLNIQKQGAAADYGIGSSAAQGMRIGLLELSGKFEVFFKDFSLYDRFNTEALGILSWALQDLAGSSYVFTLPSFTIMNPAIVAGGVGTPVVASFDLEANPDPTLGMTIQIDRFQ